MIRFHHVGVVVKSIEDSLAFLKNFGTTDGFSTIIVDDRQNVKLTIGKWNGLTIGLVEGIGEKNPVAGWLKRGVALYHLCFETDNFDRVVNELAKGDYILVSPPMSSRLFDEKRIAFFMTELGFLIEILEV